MKRLDAYPEIFETLKEPGGDCPLGSAWHTELMFGPQLVKATLFLAKETPKAVGDTLFVNMHLAYDKLPKAM